MPRMPRKLFSIVVIVATFISICYILFPGTTRYQSQDQRLETPVRIDSIWSRRVEKHPLAKFQSLPTGTPVVFPKIQVTEIIESPEFRIIREGRLKAVREAFNHSWQGYREHAWLADELRPITGTANENTFGNWSATLVDSLDTLWIMGFHQEFDEAVEALQEIDFQSSISKTINVFETTIRYMGGLLSAYELSGRGILLRKALELGHMLYAAFDTPNRMPIPYFDWKNALANGVQNTNDHAISADIGSLSLEFTKLSQLTGDMRFYDAIQRISDLLAVQQDNSTIPGLWPVFVDAASLNFATSGNEYSFGALADSLYEYLPKMHILLGGLRPEYGRMYEKAIDAAKHHLFIRPMNSFNKDLLFSSVAIADEVNVSSTDASAQHLACFVGGMVGMGAKLFDRKDDIKIASMLANGCNWAYSSVDSGIMPESIITIPCPDNKKQCPWEEKVWKAAVRAQAGDFSDSQRTEQLIQQRGIPKGMARITNGRYMLRPEAIESLFYMYRITGHNKWQDKAWEIFDSIEKASKTTHGYAAIENVAAKKLEQVDSMESFWTAETLKYLYLIFSGDLDLISLDEWVLNTEAHPFRRLLPSRRFWG